MNENKENLLRDYLKEIFFESVGASKEYLKKEAIREELQGLILKKINEGSIKSQKDLDNIWSSLDMSIKSLKMIPFDVWKNL